MSEKERIEGGSLKFA